MSGGIVTGLDGCCDGNWEREKGKEGGKEKSKQGYGVNRHISVPLAGCEDLVSIKVVVPQSLARHLFPLLSAPSTSHIQAVRESTFAAKHVGRVAAMCKVRNDSR